MAETVLRALLLTITSPSLLPARAPAPRGFELIKVADGVYAAVRKEPPGFGVDY